LALPGLEMKLLNLQGQLCLHLLQQVLYFLQGLIRVGEGSGNPQLRDV
jgi:hypothetical protein